VLQRPLLKQELQEQLVLRPDAQFPASQFFSVLVRKERQEDKALRVRLSVPASVVRCTPRARLPPDLVRLVSVPAFRLRVQLVPAAVRAAPRVVPANATFRAV